MPSNYSASARFTLQATGENNNTWGVILNQGVFQLVDDTVNGRVGFALSGSKTLSVVQGATDEARMAFLDVTGGSGGAIVIPSVPKSYFLRNASAGAIIVGENAAPSPATFGAGDAGPVFNDGLGHAYQLQIGGALLQVYIDTADHALKAYIDAAISAGSTNLPPALTNNGKALIVRMAGVPPAEAWVPDFIQQTDVVGLAAALATLQATVEGEAVAWALTL